MTTDANELSLNELNHVWAANLIRILSPDSDLRSVPRQFRERTQDSIRTDGRRHTYTQDVGASGPAGMAILEINRGDVRALSILTEKYATRVTGMQSTNRSADIAMVSRTGDPATGEFGDATVIRKFGDVPGDLSAL